MRIRLEERFEYAGQVVRLDATSRILYAYPDALARHPAADAYPASLGSELQCVVDEVGQDFVHEVGHEVHVDFLFLRPISDFHPVSGGLEADVLYHHLDERHHIARLPVGLAYGRTHLGYVQQLVHQCQQPLSLPRDGVQLDARRSGLRLQLLRAAEDDGEGRAEFVGDIREELLPGPAGFLDDVLHLGLHSQRIDEQRDGRGRNENYRDERVEDDLLLLLLVVVGLADDFLLLVPLSVMYFSRRLFSRLIFFSLVRLSV